VSKTLIRDTYECLVFGRSVLGTLIECADWVVSASHYIFMKFFYFVTILGDVIFSINKRKILCFHFIAILCGELYILFILGSWIISVIRMNFTLGFF